MSMYKGLNRFRLIALAVVATLAVGGWLAFNPNSSSTQATEPVNISGGQSVSQDASGTAFIETADFKYEIPAGCKQRKRKVLEQSGASSGFGRVASSSATFATRVSSSTPKNDDELKNNSLDDIKKNAPNFALLSSLSTKVDGRSGYKFTYSFTDKDGQNKLRQQMNVIPYKGKTFFLLFSSAAADYDKQTTEFNKILVSFKFK